MRVTFLGPTNQGGAQFYDLLADLMRATAEQLEIELEVVEGTHDPKVLLQRGREVVARASRPDYVLLANYMCTAPQLIPELDKAGIATLLVTEGLSGSDRLTVRRQGCSRFLGEIVPDDIEGGRVLAELLHAEAHRRKLQGADGKVHIGVLSGMQTIVSNLRFLGWKAFKDGTPDVVQEGLDFGGWQEHEASSAVKLLLTRAPQTNVLWCFSDVIALGAAQRAAAMGRTPGKDLLIGGFDLLDGALAAITEGAMHVSMGGHLIDGVRALLHLHDRQPDDFTPVAQTTRLEPVTAGEAARYAEFMKDKGWRTADFRRFSARLAPGASRPELSLRALVAG